MSREQVWVKVLYVTATTQLNKAQKIKLRT